MERDLARVDRAAQSANASQVRAATLADRALQAQANTINTVARAQEQYNKIATDTANKQAAAADKVAKAEQALQVAREKAATASAPDAVINKAAAAEQAAAAASANVNAVRAKGLQSVKAAEDAAATSVENLSVRYQAQKATLENALGTLTLANQRLAIAKTAEDGTATSVLRTEQAYQQQQRALRSVDLARQNLARTQIALDQAAIDGPAQVAAATELAATRTAKAEEDALAASTAASTARANLAQAEVTAREVAAAGVAQADAALEASELQLVAITNAGEAQMAAAVDANAIKIEAARAAEAQANQASVAASEKAAASVGALGAATKTGLLAGGVVAAATTAVITKLGFSYNILKESATQSFAALLHNGPQAVQFMEQLYSWTRQTSLSFQTAVSNAQEFLARGIKLKDIIPDLETIANAAAALPRPIEESMQRISYAIGQITQSAKLHSQDIRQLTEAGINAWKYLTDATGASIDEIQADAEKFGLTGPRVAEIILSAMKRDFSGVLEIQRNTARGQIAVAERNVQELSGIFTKPIFDEFIKGLRQVNDLLEDPAVKEAASNYGQAIADGMNIAIKSVKDLIDIYNKIPSINIPNIPHLNIGGFRIGLPDLSPRGIIQSTPGLRDIYNGINLTRTATNLIPSSGNQNTQLTNAVNELARLEQQRASLESRLQGGGNLQEQLRASRGQVDTEGMKAELDSLGQTIDSKKAEIDKLRQSIDAAGSSASKTADDIGEIPKSFQDMLNEATSGITAQADALKKVLQQGPVHEQLVNKLAQNQLELEQMPQRAEAEKSLRELSRAADDAANAHRDAAQAVDDQITAIQREIDARDRAEQRQEIVDRLTKNSAEKASDALDAWDRALQRQALTAGPSASDRLSQQFDLQNQAMQRADLVKAIADAGTNTKDAKQRAQEVARAQDALRKFDIQAAQKAQLDAVKANEERVKNQQALQRMDKEDQVKKLKDAEDKKKNTQELARFDRDTADKAKVQTLQDAREKIQRDAEEVSRWYDKQKQNVQDQVQILDDAKNKLEIEGKTLDLQIENAKTQASLADQSNGTKDALFKTLDDITKKFNEFYVTFNDLNEKLKKLPQIQSEATTGQEQILNALQPRASGGPVHFGQAYLVGEKHPEIFVPKSDGDIYTTVAQAAKAFANATWPGNERLLRGEVGAALDGLQGYLAHKQVAPEWMDAYGQIVRSWESSHQQYQRANNPYVFDPSQEGPSVNTRNTNNDNRKHFTNLAPININIGGNTSQQDALDMLFQRF